MKTQNYAGHARFVSGFHYVLSVLLFAGLVGSLINSWLQWQHGENIFSAVLISLLFVCCIFLFVFTRQFPLKVQDRAIRAEESLRYFILTGKQVDKRVTIAQLIALRFAPDEEFVELAGRAANEGLSADKIKQAIKNWRADHHRA